MGLPSERDYASSIRMKHNILQTRPISLTALPSTTETSAAPCSTASAIAPAAPSLGLDRLYPRGRTRQISLSAKQKPMVQQWLRNYRQLRATLERCGSARWLMLGAGPPHVYFIHMNEI